MLDRNVETLKKVGINCLICHNEKVILHKWQDVAPKKDII